MQIELIHTQGQQLNYLIIPADWNYREFTPSNPFSAWCWRTWDDLSQLKKHGIPRIVDQDPNFPFIAISPQCPTESRWINQVDILKNLLDHVQATHPVDSSRIYLTGLSMGGQGAWWLVAVYPDFCCRGAYLWPHIRTYAHTPHLSIPKSNPRGVGHCRPWLSKPTVLKISCSGSFTVPKTVSSHSNTRRKWFQH